jgi:hypothetical protein
VKMKIKLPYKKYYFYTVVPFYIESKTESKYLISSNIYVVISGLKLIKNLKPKKFAYF